MPNPKRIMCHESLSAECIRGTETSEKRKSESSLIFTKYIELRKRLPYVRTLYCTSSINEFINSNGLPLTRYKSDKVHGFLVKRTMETRWRNDQHLIERVPWERSFKKTRNTLNREKLDIDTRVYIYIYIYIRR
ncbi:hypothetical protein QLX08_002026 [Tetragonisca angustula]|uniref:Uncharacterized protein n=1 Tax=Tetragonisca angustula TaxID=166442 RepID=A0AAW1ADI1_9HYME